MEHYPWHDIPDFPDYLVTRSGIIRRKKSSQQNKFVVSQTPDSKGYLGVKLKHKTGEWKRVKVHVLMMAVFIGPRPIGLVINHIDGNKTNNSIENLEYCTHLQNERHSLEVLGKRHIRDKNGCFIFKNSTAGVV